MPASICRGCGSLVEVYCKHCGVVASPPPPAMAAIPAGPLTLGMSPPQRKLLAMLCNVAVHTLQFQGETSHRVILARPFYIDICPVTNERFAGFVRQLSDAERGRVGLEYWTAQERDPDEPAVNVSWPAAVLFAHWHGKRLPTEGEWEAAASWDPAAGAKRLFPWGDTLESPPCNRGDKLTSVLAHEVAGKSPLGCVDMVGNASEWCADPFADDYDFQSYDTLRIDPRQLVDEAPRAVRGASCRADLECLRASWRQGVDPWGRSGLIGFRCVQDALGDMHHGP